MKIPTRISLSPVAMAVFLLSALSLTLTSSSCTLKATLDTTSDGTTNFLSSTTPGAWFTGDGLVKSEYKPIAFTTLNFENLKQDMAQGRGEYLGSLGTLLGVPGDHQADFFALTREKYPILFVSDRTTPGEMLAVLQQALKSDPTLNKTVVTD